MKPLWLLGRDVATSPAPRLHNAALTALGQAPRYQVRVVPPADLDAVLDEAERSTAGINVAAPYQVRAAERFASVLDDAAGASGAVDTVVFDDARPVRAANTDVVGLLTAWRRASVDVRDRVVAVVGAGGAARAVVVAAREAGARAVAVHARRPEAAALLEARARALGLDVVDEGAHLVVLAVGALDDAGATIKRALRGPGAVHALSVGTAARTSRDAALRAGCVFLDGTSMLLARAQVALGLFLGGTPPAQASAAMSAAVSSWRTWT